MKGVLPPRTLSSLRRGKIQEDKVGLLITFHFLGVNNRIKRIFHNHGFSLRSLRSLR